MKDRQTDEKEYYLEHIVQLYEHRDRVLKDKELCGARIPLMGDPSLGSLLQAWEHEPLFTHTCPQCGATSHTAYLVGNPLTGSKSTRDVCCTCGHQFATSHTPGSFMQLMRVLWTHRASSSLTLQQVVSSACSE